MTPLEVMDVAVVNNINYGYTEQGAFNALYEKLAKGVQSMKDDEVYTIEEAWAEIDKI